MLSRLFIAALWSPEEKGLTYWIFFCVVYCDFVTSGSGVVLDCKHNLRTDSCSTLGDFKLMLSTYSSPSAVVKAHTKTV